MVSSQQQLMALPSQRFYYRLLGQDLQIFFKEKAFFHSNRIYIGFFSSNSKSAPKIDPCAKFQPKNQKAKKIKDLEFKPGTIAKTA